MRRFRLIAVPASLGVVGILLSVNSLWYLVVRNVMVPEFADLRSITSMVDCVREDGTFLLYNETCDKWDRYFNYPSLWIDLFKFLGYRESDTLVIGNVFILIFSGSLIFLCLSALLTVKFEKHSWIIFCLCIFSPPVWLLMERGNTDSLIFAASVMAVYFAKNNKLFGWLVFISVGTMLKIFPIIQLLAIPLINVSKKRPKILFLAFGALALIPWHELPNILVNNPDAKQSAYGLGVLDWSFEIGRVQNSGGNTTLSSIGIFVSCSAFFIFQKLIMSNDSNGFKTKARGLTKLTKALQKDRTSSLFLVTGAGTVSASYIVGSNFDYRLTFFIIAVVGLIRIGSESNWLIALTTASMWLSTGATPLAEAAGDALLAILVPLYSAIIFQILRTADSFRHYEDKWREPPSKSNRLAIPLKSKNIGPS